MDTCLRACTRGATWTCYNLWCELDARRAARAPAWCHAGCHGAAALRYCPAGDWATVLAATGASLSRRIASFAAASLSRRIASGAFRGTIIVDDVVGATRTSGPTLAAGGATTSPRKASCQAPWQAAHRAYARRSFAVARSVATRSPRQHRGTAHGRRRREPAPRPAGAALAGSVAEEDENQASREQYGAAEKRAARLVVSANDPDGWSVGQICFARG